MPSSSAGPAISPLIVEPATDIKAAKVKNTIKNVHPASDHCFATINPIRAIPFIIKANKKSANIASRSYQHSLAWQTSNK